MSEDGIRLDWAAAEVHDGDLTVPVHGETGKRFKRAFKAIVRRLGEHAGWSDVELHKGTVHVGDVQPGEEATLRHHLDSVVLQAATTVAEAEAAKGKTEGSDETPETLGGPDAEMTERFRGFAEPREGEGEGEGEGSD